MIRSFFVIVLGSRDGSSLPWLSILGILCDYMQHDVVFDGQWFLVRNEFLKLMKCIFLHRSRLNPLFSVKSNEMDRSISPQIGQLSSYCIC